MPKSLRVFWSSLGTFYGELFPMVGMNLLWFLFVLPIGVVLFFLLVVTGGTSPGLALLADPAFFGPLVFLTFFILLITPNPASAGLHYYANQAAREELLEFGLFWEGLRRLFARSALLFLISILGLLTLIFNVSFYLSSTNDILRVIGILWLYVIYFWLSLQMYILPLLIEQQQKSTLTILKNAALLALDNPGFTFLMFVLTFFWTLLCFVLVPLAPLGSMAVAASIQNRSLLSHLEKYGLYKPEDHS